MFQIFVQKWLKVVFLYNTFMKYKQKIDLLRHYEMLKSIGYDYCENLDLEPQSMNHSNLPNNINSLENMVKHCTLCQYSKSRKNVLFGYGNTNSKVLFIGDFNTTMEDSNGEYYIGNVGELLRKMIENVLHLKVEDVYITNILKCLPFDTQNVSTNDVNICKEYIYKQIELIKPEIIITLGQNAYSYFTNEHNWTKVRGNIIKHKHYTILPMYHPSMILRNPTLKKDAFKDMLKLQTFLNESEQ